MRQHTCLSAAAVCRNLRSGLQDTSVWTLGAEPLGSGASGTVWPVKSLLYPNVVLKQGSYIRIQAEAERLSQLNHPNIGKVYALLRGEASDHRQGGWMAMERLGPSLHVLKSAGKRQVPSSLVKVSALKLLLMQQTNMAAKACRAVLLLSTCWTVDLTVL